jgi:hypothetical protein
MLSRVFWIASSHVYKRALLSLAAEERYRIFKLNPYRNIKLFEFEHKGGDENLGTLKRPSVSS